MKDSDVFSCEEKPYDTSADSLYPMFGLVNQVDIYNIISLNIKTASDNIIIMPQKIKKIYIYIHWQTKKLHHLQKKWKSVKISCFI